MALQAALKGSLTRLNLNNDTALMHAWNRAAYSLGRLGGVSTNNKVRLYFDGDSAFDDKFAAVDAATKRTWLEIYMLEPDAVGVRMLDALNRAVMRGVDVAVVYDDIGSSSLVKDMFKRLRERGRVMRFNPVVSHILWRKNPFFRTHRKMLVADSLAFVGGMNISEDYAGAKHSGTGRFHDAHLRIQGPAVEMLAGSLKVLADSDVGDRLGSEEESLEFIKAAADSGAVADADERKRWVLPSSVTEEDLDTLRKGMKASPSLSQPAFMTYDVDPVTVQVALSNSRLGLFSIQKAMRVVLARAVRRAYYTTPYFLPPRRLTTALVEAADRGTDVRVVTAGKSDVLLFLFAGRHVYTDLISRGVRIYEYNSAHLHAKLMAADGVLGSVGTFNLDVYSGKMNLEVTCMMFNEVAAAQIEDRIVKLIEAPGTVEITAEHIAGWNILQKIVHWVAYRMVRTLKLVGF